MNKDFTEILSEHWQQKLLKEQISAQLDLYIPAIVGLSENVPSEQRKNAIDQVHEFLNNDKRLLLLLGDSGVGKTLFCHWVINDMWIHPIGWIPLFIHAPLLKIKKGYFEKYLKKYCGLNDSHIQLLKETAKILLVLDGYDEMKLKYRGINLYQVGELYNWKIKVILACRSEILACINSSKQKQMFEPYKDYQTPLPLSWQRLYVQYFDLRQQVQDYILAWKEKNREFVDSAIDYLEVINTLPGLADMISNPFILWIVLPTIPHLFKKYASKSRLDRYTLTRLELFDTFTTAWFGRQRDKLLLNEQYTYYSAISVEDYRCYCEQLANVMWQKDIKGVRYDSKKRLTDNDRTIARLSAEQNHEYDIWEVFFAPDGSYNGEDNKPLALIRQGALLRILDSNTYTFLHQSLLEYFAAKRFFTSAAIKASMAFGLEMNTKILINDQAMVRLGVDTIEADPTFEQALWDILEESKHDQRIEKAAANAITMLVAANKSFAGKDLRRVRIRFANVSYGNFDSTDFRDADLRDVNFTSAFLTNANLSGACIDRIITGELGGEKLDTVIVDCNFSPDGKYYIVMTLNEIHIYETAKNKKIAHRFFEFEMPNGLAKFVFSQDSQLILIGTALYGLILYNYLELKTRGRWYGHTKRIHGLAMNQTGSWAISASWDKTIRRWDCETGKCVLTVQDKEPFTAIVLSADDRWIFSGSIDHTIKIWNSTNGDCVSTLSGHTAQISALALSHDEGWLLSGAWDNTIKQWDLATGHCVATWKGQSGRINALAISKDDRWAVSSGEGIINKWDCAIGECITTWSGHTAHVNAVAFNSDSTWVLSGDSDGNLKRWVFGPNNSITTNHKYEKEICAFALSPDHCWILLGCSDKTITCWDSKDGKCKDVWRGHESNVVALAFNAEGTHVFSGTRDGKIKKWNFTSIECISTFDVGYNSELILSPTGIMALTVSGGSIWLWECETGKCMASWTYENYMIEHRELSFIPNCRFAMFSHNVTMHLLSIDQDNSMTTWKPTESSISALGVSPDGKWALVALNGLWDSKIQRYDVVTGKCLATWKGHKHRISHLIVSPNGEWFIACDSRHNLYVSRSKDGKILSQYSFTVDITMVNWCRMDLSFLLIVMKDGSVSGWTFRAETISLHLRWRSTPWGIMTKGCQMLGVYGLSEEQQQLFSQYGSKIKVSTKFSEDKVTAEGNKEGILSKRNAWIPFQIGQEVNSVFDDSYMLWPTNWVVTLARQKSGRGEQHVFLILESIEDGYYRLRRMEFVLELRHQMLPNGASPPVKTDKFGQGLIEVSDKSFEDIKAISEQCYFKLKGITSEQGIRLLANIYKDQESRLGYSLPGAGNIYRMFRMSEVIEHHNCMSWCEKHLEAIDIKLTDKSWHDPFVNNPIKKLTGDNKASSDDEEHDTGSKCVLM